MLSQRTIQALPHTVPMASACTCMVLMFAYPSPLEVPAYFQIGITLIAVSAIGWAAVAIGNDYAHFKFGLLKPQRRRTVCLIVALGSVVASGRLLHLAGAFPSVTLEWLQRLLVGVPFYTCRLFGLDMWGYAIGVTSFALFATLGFLAFCAFNCCGRVRTLSISPPARWSMLRALLWVAHYLYFCHTPGRPASSPPC